MDILGEYPPLVFRWGFYFDNFTKRVIHPTFALHAHIIPFKKKFNLRQL